MEVKKEENVELISSKLELLRSEIKANEEMFLRLVKAYGGKMHQLDLLAYAVLHRSQALIDGFCKMVEDRNIDCAAPLVRLQIDNCLRFYASYILSEPHDFAMKVFSGTQVRKLKDKDGKFMTDAHLVDKLSKEDTQYAFIKNLYEETSGFVHLSQSHIRKSLGEISLVDDTFNFKFYLSQKNNKFPKAEFIKVIDAFSFATKILTRFMEGWIFSKSNPEKVRELGKKLGII